MVDITDEEIVAAEERGRIASEREPRAKAAHYERETGRIIVELKHNCFFTFPARLAQGLEHASDEEIAEVEVIGLGHGLHWETLNEDHSIPALVAGIFGSRKYMARLVEQGVLPADWNDATFSSMTPAKRRTAG